MIAIVVKTFEMRTAEYTSAMQKKEKLIIKDMLVLSELGLMKVSVFGEQARQAESMNLQEGNVIIANITITAHKSSSQTNDTSYFNDISMTIVEKLG